MTTSRTLLEYVAGRDHQMLAAEVANPDQLAAAVAAVKRGALLQAAEAPRFAEQAIRVAAYPIAAVVAMVGPDDEPTVLDEVAGWTKVAYRGVVGYVAGD